MSEVRMPLASGKCPVDHKALAAARATQQQAVEQGGPAAAKCPVDHTAMLASSASGAEATASAGAAGKCPVDHAALGAASTQAAAGKCPVDHAAMAEAQGGAQAGGEAPPKAVCPFGFSNSTEGNRPTSLHCPKCHSLFYDCVRTNCGHHFCRDCVQEGKQCLSCGDDIVAVTPNNQMQEMVELFIDTHSSDETFLDGKPITVEGSDSEKDAEATKATFLLELGLRSLAGGNFRAAAVRLGLARQQLQGMVAARGATAELSTQLGAVCGSQGDCSVRQGDHPAALTSYEASVKHLEACSTHSPEVRQALTVTLNKSGDLQYRIGDLGAAEGFYTRALGIRRDSLAISAADDEPRLQLDVALSLAKVADIQQALGNDESAQTAIEEAREVTERLCQHKDALDAALSKRLEALEAHLRSV